MPQSAESQRPPILSTKLAIPPLRQGRIARLRLLARIDHAIQRLHRIILITAPAGFGKTMLASEWVHQSSTPATWLSITADDNTINHYLYNLHLALQKLTDGQFDFPEFDPEAPPRVGMTLLINAIARIGYPFTLVLDDFHLITDNEIHQMMDFFLEHLPPQVTVLLISRTTPPLSLTRLRVRGQLADLKQEDLRFTRKETEDFFRETINFQLTDDHLDHLESQTEGWAAALQMAALSFPDRIEEVSAFISSFDAHNRYIEDFLLSEVLNTLSGDLRDFLLRTSVLDTLTGALCDAVTGQDDSAAVLEELARRNLFIIPLDEKRYWYRYHHLFQQLLQKKLKDDDPFSLKEGHRKASLWYESNGHHTQAINHAIRAEDFSLASSLIIANNEVFFKRSDLHSLRLWFDQIPEEAGMENPELSLIEARGLLLTGHLAQATQLLDRALVRLKLLPQEGYPRVLMGRYFTMRASIERLQGDSWYAIELAEKAQEYLPKTDILYNSATIILAQAYNICGPVEKAVEAFQEAIQISDRNDNVFSRAVAQSGLAHSLLLQAKLFQCEDLCLKTIETLNTLKKNYYSVAGRIFIRYGDLLYEWDRLDEARECMLEAIKRGEEENNTRIIASSKLSLTRLDYLENGLSVGLESVTSARNTIKKYGLSSYETLLDAYEAWFYIREGDLTRATEWERRFLREKGHNCADCTYHSMHNCLNHLRLAILRDDLERALELSENSLERTKLQGWTLLGQKVAILRAAAFLKRGDLLTAYQLTESVLVEAERENIVRFFLDEAQFIQPLLRDYCDSHSAHTDYARQILTLVEEEIGLTDAHETEITEREMIILRHLAEGLSNKELGDHLSISVNTVKTHLKHIFSKLDVKNRTEASAKARRLGIID